MTETDASARPAPPPSPPDAKDVDGARMSFGDHLEELRIRLIQGLIGLAVGTTLSLVFAKHVLAILFRPLLIVLDSHGLRPSLLAMGVPDVFLGYLKMGLLCGLVVAAPWLIYQAWLFVSAGMYRHERRFIKLFGPASAALFATGVAFLYVIVLPIVLNFFVTFNQSFDLPELAGGGLMEMILGSDDEATPQSADGAATPIVPPTIPLLDVDPKEPAVGAIWVHRNSRRLKIQTEDGLLTMLLERGMGTGAVRSEFGLQFYISFVLTLMLAFGIAFEMPVAVVFLVMTGIVTTAMLAKGRRYVIFGLFILTALLTPPDVVSQVLLALPMIGLFEAGLIVARVMERRRKVEDTAAGA